MTRRPDRRLTHYVGWDVIDCHGCGEPRDGDGLDGHDCANPTPMPVGDPLDLDLLGTATSAAAEHHERHRR